MRSPVPSLRPWLRAACLALAASAAVADDDRAAREAVEALEAYAVYKMAQYELAYARFEALAQKGNLQGMLNVANMLQAGLGVARDEAAAADWYRRAAARGSALGMYQLGRAYREGRGVAANPDAATRWLTRAAEGGLGEAALALGRQLFDAGEREAGLDWIRRAAAAGEPGAERYLAAATRPTAAADAVAPLARAAIEGAFAAIDRAAVNRNAPGVVYYLAPDAEIRLRLPGTAGWIELTRRQLRDYWQQTFDRAATLALARGPLRLSADGDAITVESEIVENIGHGAVVETLRLGETARVRLHDDRVTIERLTLVVERG